MALCEIKTGQGSKVPKECSDWQGGKGKVGVCVEALARSPQFWSSYSGTFSSAQVVFDPQSGVWHSFSPGPN